MAQRVSLSGDLLRTTIQVQLEDQNAALLVNGMTTALLLTVGPWAGHRFGMLGVSWASTIVLGLQTVCTWWLARRLVGVWTHVNGSLAAVIKGAG